MSERYGNTSIDFDQLGGSGWIHGRDGEVARHLAAVFGWMAMATGLTGFTSYALSSMDNVMATLTTWQGQLVTVLAYFGLFFWTLFKARNAMDSRAREGTKATAILSFFLFALATGVLLTPIFTVYTLGSVATTFFTCAITFGFFTCFGFFTRINLLRFGGFLFMALIGLIVSEVMLMFSMAWGWLSPEGNMLFYHLSGAAGVLIFVGLTAYDSQRIKMEALQGNTTVGHQIFSALDLYLDFVNLFLYLLRFFGQVDD